MKTRIVIVLALVMVFALSAAIQAGAQAGAVPLCADVTGITNPIVRAGIPSGTVSGGSVYCRIIAQNGAFIRTSAEIGSAAVINQGVVQAVDVFGMLPGGQWVTNFSASVEVCLQGSGSLVYLDARQSPRQPATLGGSSSDGYTCVSISGPGTVVLTGTLPTPVGSTAASTPVPGASAIQGTPSVGSAGTLASIPIGTIIDLTESGCTGRTTKIVRLRTEPNTTTSSVIDTLPYDLRFRVTGVTNGWVRIVYRDGQGWVSGQFFRLGAGCAF